jgi:hypothetical protein
MKLNPMYCSVLCLKERSCWSLVSYSDSWHPKSGSKLYDNSRQFSVVLQQSVVSPQEDRPILSQFIQQSRVEAEKGRTVTPGPRRQSRGSPLHTPTQTQGSHPHPREMPRPGRTPTPCESPEESSTSTAPRPSPSVQSTRTRNP